MNLTEAHQRLKTLLQEIANETGCTVLYIRPSWLDVSTSDKRAYLLEGVSIETEDRNKPAEHTP